jgi:hypothetical protein
VRSPYRTPHAAVQAFINRLFDGVSDNAALCERCRDLVEELIAEVRQDTVCEIRDALRDRWCDRE